MLNFAQVATILQNNTTLTLTKVTELEKNIRFLGSYSERSEMNAAAFDAIYNHDGSLATAIYDDNLVMFMRSDDANEEYLLMIDAANYRIYKLSTSGARVDLFQRIDELHQLTANYADTKDAELKSTLEAADTAIINDLNAEKASTVQRIANTISYIDQQIAALVNGAPAEIDTFLEVANKIRNMLSTDTTLMEFMEATETDYVTNANTNVSLTLVNNTIYDLTNQNISIISATIPSNIGDEFACSIHWTSGNVAPVLSFTNNSNLELLYLLNNVRETTLTLTNNAPCNCLIIKQGKYIVVKVEELNM